MAEDLHALVEGERSHHQVEDVPGPSASVHQRDDHEALQGGNPQYCSEI